MPRPAPVEEASAGFTLIEVLVALSIVAIALSSIGALIASTSRGARAIEANLKRLQIARAVMTALPDRHQLVPGNSWGEIADHQWRIDVSSFAWESVGLSGHSPWVPQSVLVTIKSPIGAATQVTTVRLRKEVKP